MQDQTELTSKKTPSTRLSKLQVHLPAVVLDTLTIEAEAMGMSRSAWVAHVLLSRHNDKKGAAAHGA